ncbi:MAG: helix-hairpin-helix domain-containing protein [Candidatus Omnitrophica bacterium]|nr:helix-hairpin-helix domain-containing protein [Candidatus Omnitrophota bacterium]MCA9432901.1 helix-hairpin-helix domain-containing protein [Candidatus Omnitrophota bacterium]MCA9435930.1 helix-hairpin-helix domain-containing protein [Candidatus Omnitrophota bacterium]MCA9443309.1 helix-hairpin-helix domain-containing protein [Candidatus Omnitrophota bacterium]MCA9449035.1 helix-hairpin-helix domain-containing protein [Candidatus Omnitrophota bacterium]
MNSLNRQNRELSDPAPEPPAPDRKHILDRYEGLLVAALLVLVIGLQFKDQFVPTDSEDRLEVVRGAESKSLGPIHLLDPPDPKPLPQRDLNSVSRQELMAISGIGPAMADAILTYREENGNFRTFDELERVPGIGPKRLELFSKYLTVPGSGASPSEPNRLMKGPETEGDANPAPGSHREIRTDETIHLNEADRSELTQIPGIGEAFADRIVRQREKLGKFRSWADLDAVSGVGPKRLENLKAHATID